MRLTTSLRTSRGWFAACVLILLIVALADRLDPHSSLVVSCALAPFLASATCSMEVTAMVALLSLVVGGWLLSLEPDAEPSTVLVRIAVLLFAAALAPLVARSREHREARLGNLARVATVAQQAVLTPVPPVAGPLRLATAYESASEDALIGGDLFGVVNNESRTRLVIGDVKGKGLEAVNHAALTLAAFREAALGSASLMEVGEYCDNRLLPHLAEDEFVTALFADVAATGEVELVSYGHPAPLLIRHLDTMLLEFDYPGGPLGLGLETDPPVPLRLGLAPGDRVLFFTDGLVEARDRQGQFLDAASWGSDLGATEFDHALKQVLAQLHARSRSIDDDLALLLVEYTGIPGPFPAPPDRGDGLRHQNAPGAGPSRSSRPHFSGPGAGPLEIGRVVGSSRRAPAACAPRPRARPTPLPRAGRRRGRQRQLHVNGP